MLVYLLCLIPLSLATINDRDDTLCDGTEYAQNIYDKLSNSKLISEEYSIVKGYMVWWPNMTIWAANPNGIYGIYEIPPFWGKYETKYGIQLRSMDAMIFIGCTPPMAHYYSWDSYLYYRYFDVTNASWLFASVNDALNHLLINTSTTNTFNSSYSAFNSLTTIITTGDKQTFNDINYTINSSDNYNDINLMSIPQKYFNFIPYGMTTITPHLSYDTFMTLIRIALPLSENNTLFQQYTSYNQSVLYLQKINVNKGVNKPRIPFEPNVKSTYSPNNINETETYLNYLLEYMNDLIVNISTQYSDSLSFVNYSYFNNAMESTDKQNYGYSCIEKNVPCVGDDRDAQYFNANITNLQNNIFIIIGVNSYNVGLSSAYQSFAYYDESNNMGPTSLTNFQYNSSVIDLNITNTNISTDILSKFYVIQYIRPNNNLIKNIPIIPIMEGNWSWIELFNRDYLNIITKTRPDKNQMIPPILITFSFK